MPVILETCKFWSCFSIIPILMWTRGFNTDQPYCTMFVCEINLLNWNDSCNFPPWNSTHKLTWVWLRWWQLVNMGSHQLWESWWSTRRWIQTFVIHRTGRLCGLLPKREWLQPFCSYCALLTGWLTQQQSQQVKNISHNMWITLRGMPETLSSSKRNMVAPCLMNILIQASHSLSFLFLSALANDFDICIN